MINHSLLRCAHTRECNTQQKGGASATAIATLTQQPTLKALASKVLERNSHRNTNATMGQKPRNNEEEKRADFVALKSPQNDVPRGGTNGTKREGIKPHELSKEPSSQYMVREFNTDIQAELGPSGHKTFAVHGVGKADAPDAVFSLYQQYLQDLKLPEPWKVACMKTLTRSRPPKIEGKTWNAILTHIHHWIGTYLCSTGDVECRHCPDGGDSNGYKQLQEMIEKGYTLQHIFGCDADDPQADSNRKGLLLTINNNTIAQITEDVITFHSSSGFLLEFYKKTMTLRSLNCGNSALIYTLPDPR